MITTSGIREFVACAITIGCFGIMGWLLVTALPGPPISDETVQKTLQPEGYEFIGVLKRVDSQLEDWGCVADDQRFLEVWTRKDGTRQALRLCCSDLTTCRIASIVPNPYKP